MISTFPSYVFIDDSSIREVRINNTLRSPKFEVGPEKVRAISCRTTYQLEFEIGVCLEKYSDFLRWYEQILGQGSLWFFMICPLRGEKFRFRFLGNDLDFRKVGEKMEAKVSVERYGNGIQ